MGHEYITNIKVLVTGTTGGTGSSTLSREIATVLGVPRITANRRALTRIFLNDPDNFFQIVNNRENMSTALENLKDLRVDESDLSVFNEWVTQNKLDDKVELIIDGLLVKEYLRGGSCVIDSKLAVLYDKIDPSHWEVLISDGLDLEELDHSLVAKIVLTASPEVSARRVKMRDFPWSEYKRDITVIQVQELVETRIEGDWIRYCSVYKTVEGAPISRELLTSTEQGKVVIDTDSKSLARVEFEALEFILSIINSVDNIGQYALHIKRLSKRIAQLKELLSYEDRGFGAISMIDNEDDYFGTLNQCMELFIDTKGETSPGGRFNDRYFLSEFSEGAVDGNVYFLRNAEGKVVSAVYTTHRQLKQTDNQTTPSIHIERTATRTESRGMGYMTSLIEFIKLDTNAKYITTDIWRIDTLRGNYPDGTSDVEVYERKLYEYFTQVLNGGSRDNISLNREILRRIHAHKSRVELGFKLVKRAERSGFYYVNYVCAIPKSGASIDVTDFDVDASFPNDLDKAESLLVGNIPNS